MNLFFPDIVSLKINNFSLYPNGLSFSHQFVKGVNLIIGGNGMGKTTLVNLIRYAIIGHYKDGFDLTRTYKGNKIEKRTSLPWNYFSSRKNLAIQTQGRPSIEIEFHINNNLFQLKRSLEEISVLDVIVNNKALQGDTITQQAYDNMFYEYSRASEDTTKKSLKTKLENTLQFKFEQAVETASNMPFDDLIFFVNKILFFGEDHKTVLWNDDIYADVQTELFNKYFNDRELNHKRQEANRQAKYFDTQARHRSEDIRVIKSVLDKSKSTQQNGEPLDNVPEMIVALKRKMELLNTKLESIQSQRSKIDHSLGLTSNSINSLNQEAAKVEISQKKIEKELMQSSWVKLHPQYENYLKSISSNELCPMCSQEVTQNLIADLLHHSDNCILCKQEIKRYSNDILDNEQNEIKAKLAGMYLSMNEMQREVYNFEEELVKLDKEFKIIGVEKRKCASELRVLEYNDLKDKAPGTEDSHQAFYDEIEELELLKQDFQEKSKIEKEKATEISQTIETQIIKNVREFSTLFSSYAERFLGVQCSLTFEELNGQKRFFPVIDGKIREQEEELSESQRFFVDHSFRMSILSFFYNKPSFYIVETPDSSLDISYERNAADVFNQFIEKNPYCLILTTNLNNSEFLNYLIKTFEKISVIDLISIGKKSPIQGTNDSLSKVYTKVLTSINERVNN